MVSFAEKIIEFLENIGFFRIFVPLLLVWTITFAILISIPFFKENKPLAAIISLAVSLPIIYVAEITKLLNYFTASFSVFLVFLFFFTVLALFAGIKQETLAQWATKSHTMAVTIFVTLIIFFVSLYFAFQSFFAKYAMGGGGESNNILYLGFRYIFHPTFFLTIIFLLFIGLAILFITRLPSGK